MNKQDVIEQLPPEVVGLIIVIIAIVAVIGFAIGRQTLPRDGDWSAGNHHWNELDDKGKLKK